MANDKVQNLNQGRPPQPPTKPAQPAPPAEVDPSSPRETAPQKPIGTSDWLVECETYLLAHGWVRRGYNSVGQIMWGDPLTIDYGPTEPVPVVLPVKGEANQTTTILQTRGAPIAWDFETVRAVDIQRTRDAYKAKTEPWLLERGWTALGPNAYRRDVYRAPDELQNVKLELSDAVALQKQWDTDKAQERAIAEYRRKRALLANAR